MSATLKLNLDEVRSLLGLSTDSILNHIGKGTLSAGKLQNKGEDLYVFEFKEVKDFAKEYLDMTVNMPKKAVTEETDDNLFEDMGNVEDEDVSKGEEVKKKSKPTKKAEKNNTEDKGGISNLISNLQKSYESALKQMSDYKEQAAFRIGQLEGELSSQKKLLSSGRQEMAEKDRLVKKLKIELKKTRENLEKESIR